MFAWSWRAMRCCWSLPALVNGARSPLVLEKLYLTITAQKTKHNPNPKTSNAQQDYGKNW